MIDADRLLGAILTSGARSASSAIGRDLGRSLFGGSRRGASSRSGGLFGSAGGAVLASVAGAVVGHLISRGTGALGGILGGGGQAPAPTTPASPVPGGRTSMGISAAPPTAPAPTGDAALAAIKTMIAAAKADGTIDATESGRIIEQLSADGLTAEEQSFLQAEFARPFDIDALVREATTPEAKATMLAAALLAVDETVPANAMFVELLAAKLGLDQPAVAAIKAEAARIEAGQG